MEKKFLFICRHLRGTYCNIIDDVATPCSIGAAYRYCNSYEPVKPNSKTFHALKEEINHLNEELMEFTLDNIEWSNDEEVKKWKERENKRALLEERLAELNEIFEKIGGKDENKRKND